MTATYYFRLTTQRDFRIYRFILPADALYQPEVDSPEILQSVHITEVGVLRIRQVLESELMCDLADNSILATIPCHQDKTRQYDQPDVHSVHDDVHQETGKVSWRVFRLEDLRRDEVANRPAHEHHCHYRTLLGLASNVAGDQRDDHIALSAEELSAVECDEHAARVPGVGLDDEDDDRTGHGR
jgi:hypothetical protein